MDAIIPIVCAVASVAAAGLWLFGWAVVAGMNHGSAPAFDGGTLVMIWGVAGALLIPGLLAFLLWRKNWSGAGRLAMLVVGYGLSLYLSVVGASGASAFWKNEAARESGSVEGGYALLSVIILICGLTLLASTFLAQRRTTVS